MPLSRKQRYDDEDVLLETRPHWSLLVLPSLVGLVVVGGVTAVFVVWSSAPVWFGWVMLAVALLGVGYFLGRVWRWRATELIVTSKRIIYRRGALHRIGREIPISNVQNVEYRQSLFERILGKGHLTVESASGHDTEPIPDLPRPHFVQSTINRAIDAARRADPQQSKDGDPDQTKNGAGLADELERLANLHRRGVITDGEFARLKGDLINDDEPGEQA